MFSRQGLTQWYRDKNLPLQHKLFRYLDDNGNEIDSVSFADLDIDARRVASYLINVKKLKAGDRALLMYTPGLDFLRVFMGAIYAGVTVVTAMPPLPNNFAYSMGAAIKIITDSGSSICLASNLVLKMIKMQLLLRHRKLNQRLPKDFEWIDYSNAVGHKDENFTEPEISPESTLMLQYSSGSTGDPKGIILTHENIFHNCTQIFNFTGAKPTSSGLSWLPMYHDMGLIGHFFTPLLVAGTQWLISPLSFLKRPSIWLELISKLKVGFSGGPNFAYSLLAEKFSDAKFYPKDFDLSSWTMAFCGAEPINTLTLKKFSTAFAKFGFKEESFYPVYGLGEATLLVTYPRRESKTVPTCLKVSRSAMAENKRVESKTLSADDTLEITGLGAPEKDTQLLIVNPNTRLPSLDGEVGEIWVNNKSVAKGYWNKKQLSNETFRNFTADNQGPFMRTGDLGFVQNGELFFASRNKDLVIINGANHWPQDIESTVERAHSLLRKGCCAAFAVSSESSEELCVVAEVKKGVHISINSLHAIRRAIKLAVQTNHSLALSEDHLILVSAGKVPKTTSGKIRRSTCRDMMLAQELKPYRPKSSHWSRTALISSAVALLALWKFSPFQISQWFYVAVLVFMALIVPAVSYVKGVVRHYRKQKEFNAAYTSKAKEIEQFIVELLKSNAGIVITDLHKPLAEYGLKSIDVALAVGELERYLEQDISPTCFYECKNIKELASYLALKSVEQSTLTNKESRPTATSARVQKTSPLNQRTAQPTSSAAYVLAMGKALPENYYPQQLSARALIESSTIPANQPEMVEKIVKFFTANGIEGRHMVLSLDELTKLGSTEHRNEYYVREAPKLATAAAREAIANWGGDLKDITHVISVSCTGTLVPGLEFYIMDSLGLNKSVARLGVNFMGCFGGLTALRTASEIARASPHHRVLVVCTELCSLHVQKDDARIDNLIAESLFGDGAAALIMGSAPRTAEEPKYEVLNCISGALEGSMDQIRWDLSDSGWKVGLESQISKLLGGNIEPFASQLMNDQKSSELTWAIHPGGKAIINTIEEKLSIPKDRTKSTWEVYNKFGNVSSGTIYFVLENILNKQREAPVDTCQDVVALAFGPGLAMEGARLKLCTPAEA